MNEKQAIEILEALLLLSDYHRNIALVPSEKQALSVAISDMRKMQYLEGIPCEVCSCHNETGCGVWECMFDGKEAK